MKILKTGHRTKKPEDVPCACIYCSCVFLFRDDEANLIDDSRDGDYYRVACPECGVLNSVSVKLKGSAPTRRTDP